MCSRCDGDGEVQPEENRRLREAWEPTEPPAGEGYQFWETVSEGSPISPVFPDKEGLAQWMADNETQHEMSQAEWLKFIEMGGNSVGFAINNEGRYMTGPKMMVTK